MADEDDNWLDALAGARASADQSEQREHEAIRAAARRLEPAQPDELAEQRLLRRLENEGLLARKQARQRQGYRHLARAAVVVLCLGVVLEWFVFRPEPESPAVLEDAAGPEREALTPQAEPVPQEARAAARKPSRREAALAAKAEREAEAEADEWLRLREEALRQRAGSSLAIPGGRATRITIDVQRRAPVVDELKQLIDTPGLRRVADPTADADVAEEPNPGEIWLLCDEQAACDQINDWLQEHDAARVFEPGRLVRLYLREP